MFSLLWRSELLLWRSELDLETLPRLFPLPRSLLFPLPRSLLFPRSEGLRSEGADLRSVLMWFGAFRVGEIDSE